MHHFHSSHLFDQVRIALLQRLNFFRLPCSILGLLEFSTQLIDLLILTRNDVFDVAQSKILLLLFMLSFVQVFHGRLKLQLAL